MLNLWQRTLQYIEEQNAWISSLQSIIVEKEQNYKSIHSLITKEILKELGRLTVDVDVKIEADVKEECSDVVIDDIQPTQELQIDAEEVADINRLLFDCNRRIETTTCTNENEETSIDQMNSNVAVITEDQDGIMEDQDDINEEQDEEIKMNCESSSDYEDNENKAEGSDHQKIIHVEKLEDRISENIEELKKFNEFQPDERKKCIQQKNKQEETDSESYHVIKGTSEKHNDTRMENEAGFDDVNVPADTTYDEQHKYTGEKPFKCSYCEKSFQQSDDLEEHILKHKLCETPYKCIYCPMTFRHNDSLQSHMYIHTDDKDRLKCIMCKKYFNRASDLQKHMRNHIRNPFKCSDCGKKFRIMTKWKTHIMRTYTCKKPLKCTHCDKSFTFSYNLRCHMRMHTGEKPFKCVECDKLFTFPNCLTKHMRVHASKKTFKCAQCSKSFAFSNCLARHMRIHAAKKHSNVHNP